MTLVINPSNDADDPFRFRVYGETRGVVGLPAKWGMS
jgi:hypothetical protein